MSSLTPRLDKIQAGNNLAINGGMDFWQRGLTFTINNNAAYTADRMQVFHSQGGGNTVTVDRVTDVPTFAQSKFNSRYSLKITNNHNAAITGNSAISYNVEGNDYVALHNGYGRVQFWCKSSVAGDYAVSFRNNNNDRSYVSKFTLTANTWTLIQKDIAFDTTGTWSFDNALGVRMFISISAPVSGQTATLDQWQSGNFSGVTTPSTWNQTVGATFFMTQLDIVPGDFTNLAATVIPFSRAGKTISDELRMCQRYYEKSYPVDTPPLTSIGSDGGFINQGTANNSGVQAGFVNFKVNKRAMPTMSHAIVTTLGQITRVNTSFAIVDTVTGGSWSPTENGATFTANASSTSGFVAQWIAVAEL